MIKVLIWLLGILIFGIGILILSIIHYFKVCKEFIKKEGLEEYQNNEEWFN